jgi:hypothetical protein
MARRALWLASSTVLAFASLSCGDDDGTTESASTGSGGAGASGSTSSASGGGGPGSGGGGTGSGGATSYQVCDNPPPNYPEGPYGNEVGDTLPLLQLQGYANPGGDQLATDGTFGAFSTDDIRQAGSPHVMIHLAATW